MSPLAHHVKMPEDCFCIFPLPLWSFYSWNWNKTWLGFVGTKIQPHLLFALQCCLKYHFNFTLVACQRRSPIKETKKKSVNSTFHEEHHSNKAACKRTQKVRDGEPYCACQLGCCMQGKRGQNLQGCCSLKWYVSCWWAREGNKKPIQNNWRTAWMCWEKNSSHWNFKGFKGEIKYYLLRYKNHFWNNNPIKNMPQETTTQHFSFDRLYSFLYPSLLSTMFY